MPQVALDNTTAELADTRKQLTTVDSERTAAAKRSSTLMTQWEERDAAREEEVSKLRCGTSRKRDCTDQHRPAAACAVYQAMQTPMARSCQALQ